ncbi:MAG TPA: AAA family ATPase, partial [Chloroflexota bacterium]
MEREQRRDRVDPAIAHARRALAIDPLQEQLHQTLMRLYFQQGDRASALTQFQTCERFLRDALGVGPTTETRSLRDAIAAGRAIRSPSRASVAVIAEPAEAVPKVLSRRRQYRLVGREAELARLSGQLAAPPGRGSRLFLVQGEAGIGKTRLVEELLAQVADPPTERSRETDALGSAQWTVLIGHSYPDAEGLPYHPIVEALRGRLALLAVDTLPVADVWLAEVNRLLPEIGVQRPHLSAPARLDPPQERRRLYEGVAQLLAALGQRRLVVLEDLHWADGETLHLLAYLARHERLRDTVFLATLRPEDVTDSLEQILTSLEYEGRLERLSLGPLSQPATAALVGEITAEAPSALADHTYRESEGNPLFAIELTHSLLEAGAWSDGSAAERSEGVALPATMQAIIRSRLVRLDLASREFLNSAAVFRRALDFDEVRQVTEQSNDAALTALEQLLRVQILRETSVPVATGVIATYYTFSHDQIRRVVYESLSDARRRLLHRRVVELLEAAPEGPANPKGAISGERHAEELAYHACRGQAWSTALRWSEQAAADASRLCAYESAAHLYEQALACA